MNDRKLAAIVFTDIVGYTKRMEADEDSTMALLARQREIIFPLVKEFGGEVIKEIGDGLLMMFNSAGKAVRFAMAMQEKLREDELTIRAGIHIGDVIFEEGDVFGSAVNIAARIEPLALAGGICISEDVRSQIRNQKDIITVSIGKKELKGVNEPIEIYRIASTETIEPEPVVPFYKDLWRRRVFQITGLYLILAFLIRTGMGYIVREYMLSPHLVNLVWFIFLALLPSIILMSYFHGRKEISRWSRVELVGLPLNIVIALLIAVFVFKGKDLGAITTTLTVQNEDGESVEKVIVKKEFRKKIFLFNVQNISGDQGLNYLQYGMPAMIQLDLSQDVFINTQSAMDIYPKMAEAGYEDAVGMPITLMRHLAEQRHMNYFLTGDLDKQKDEYVLNIKLYDTQYSKLISEISVRDRDPFGLVDQLTPAIKKAMGLPESHISETADLPVSEILTASEKALYYFSMSIKENALNNWAENVRLLDLAIKEDPSFALAYVSITISYFNTNNYEAAQSAMNRAMELLYKLPERQKFIVKYVHYVLGQEPEKAMAVVKMWVDLYPDDMLAHTTLAQRYAVRNMYQEAIHEYKEILRLDPEQYQILITLGDYYLQLGNFDSSLVYYKIYAEKYPQQAVSYRNLGDYYSLLGDMEQARENYEKALLVADASEEVTVKIDLANISMKTGHFDIAHEEYLEALSISKTARDSARIFNALENYYLTKGQVHTSLESYEQKLAKYKTFLPPKDILVFRVFTIEPYVNAGELDRAFKILEELKSSLEPPLDNIVPFGYMVIYAETGDAEKAREAISGAEDLIKGFGEEVLKANIYYTQAKINELLGEYQSAIDFYTRYLMTYATEYEIHSYISRCYRNLKEFKKAEEEIQISLKFLPFDPTVNYEAALLYLEKGDREKGMEYLEKAVEIWKDADSDYQKANLAKEKLDSLNMPN